MSNLIQLAQARGTELLYEWSRARPGQTVKLERYQRGEFNLGLNPLPFQPGVHLVGEPGEHIIRTAAPWTKDGGCSVELDDQCRFSGITLIGYAPLDANQCLIGFGKFYDEGQNVPSGFKAQIADCVISSQTVTGGAYTCYNWSALDSQIEYTRVKILTGHCGVLNGQSSGSQGEQSSLIDCDVICTAQYVAAKALPNNPVLDPDGKSLIATCLENRGGLCSILGGTLTVIGDSATDGAYPIWHDPSGNASATTICRGVFVKTIPNGAQLSADFNGFGTLLPTGSYGSDGNPLKG